MKKLFVLFFVCTALVLSSCTKLEEADGYTPDPIPVPKMVKVMGDLGNKGAINISNGSVVYVDTTHLCRFWLEPSGTGGTPTAIADWTVTDSATGLVVLNYAQKNEWDPKPKSACLIVTVNNYVCPGYTNPGSVTFKVKTGIAPIPSVNSNWIRLISQTQVSGGWQLIWRLQKQYATGPYGYVSNLNANWTPVFNNITVSTDSVDFTMVVPNSWGSTDRVSFNISNNGGQWFVASNTPKSQFYDSTWIGSGMSSPYNLFSFYINTATGVIKNAYSQGVSLYPTPGNAGDISIRWSGYTFYMRNTLTIPGNKIFQWKTVYTNAWVNAYPYQLNSTSWPQNTNWEEITIPAAFYPSGLLIFRWGVDSANTGNIIPDFSSMSLSTTVYDPTKGICSIYSKK